MLKLGISEKEITDAIYYDFKKILEKIESKNEEIYAVAFITDSNIQSLNILANTEQSLIRTINYYNIKVYPNSKNDDAQFIRNISLRWNPSEWSYDCSDITHSKISKISKKLFSTKIIPCAETKAEFFELLCNTIKKLDENGLFSPTSDRNKITLFMSISDDDNAIDMENYSAKLLNTDKIYNEFRIRYDK